MSKKFLAYVARSQAGKDVVCALFQEILSAQSHEVIRFSDSLGRTLERMRGRMEGGSELLMSRHNYQWLSTILREEYDPDLLANRVRRSAEESSCDWVHMMGMRKLVDIPMVRSLGKEDSVFIVHVDAPAQLRHKWVCRSADRKGIQAPSWDEFRASDEQECEIEIDEIAAQADYHIVNAKDDATFERLREQTTELATRLGM